MDTLLIQDIYDQWLVGTTAFVGLVSFIQTWLSKDKSYLWYGIYVLLNGLYFGIFAFSFDNQYLFVVGYSSSEQGALTELLLLGYLAYHLFLISFLRLKTQAYKVYRIIRGFAYYLIVATIVHGILVRTFGDFF